MPEGHSIHRLAQAFTQLKSLGAVRASSPQGRFAQGASQLDGAHIVTAFAWGKHLFLLFANRQENEVRTICEARKQAIFEAREPAGAEPERKQVGAEPGKRQAAEAGTGLDLGQLPDYVNRAWETWDLPEDWTHYSCLHVHLGLYGSWRFQTEASVELPTHIGAPRLPREHLGDQVTVVAGASEFSEKAGLSEKTGGTKPAGPGEGDNLGQVNRETHQVAAVADQPDFFAPGPNVRLRLAWDRAVADLSGPTQCEILSLKSFGQLLNRLGPDPLIAACQATDFIDLAQRSARPIGTVVMDQKIAAGPGNIYRAECLFRIGISPQKPAKQVSRGRLENLWNDLRIMMQKGVEEGRIVTVSSSEKAQGKRFYVYQRQGEPCLKCGTQIKLAEVAGRKLFWCPRCQRR